MPRGMCVFRHPNFIILPERNRIDHTNPQDRHTEMQSFPCFHEAYISHALRF